MTSSEAAPQPDQTTLVSPPSDADDAPWHGLTAEQACARLGADARLGLDPAEVERRRAEVGPNKLAEGEKEPGWHAFLRQFEDLMQLVLLGAAVVSVVAIQDFHTAIVILVVVLLNAVLGLNQEGKAAESVAAPGTWRSPGFPCRPSRLRGRRAASTVVERLVLPRAYEGNAS